MTIKLPELFNLTAINFTQSPTFLRSFTAENIEAFNQAIRCVKDAIHYQPHYSPQAVSELKTLWDEKRAAFKATTLEEMGEFTKTLLDANRYFSDKKKSEKLNQKLFWNDLFANEILQTNMLKRIHAYSWYVLWQEQAHFALHSNESLLWLLPIIEKTLLQAQSALAEMTHLEPIKRQAGVATPLMQAWQSFLSHLTTSFERLRKSMLSAMYARLVVASYAYQRYGQLNTDDVIWYVQDVMQTEGLYSVAKERICFVAKAPLSPRQTLTPTMACEFLNLLYQKSAPHWISRYDELTFGQPGSEKDNEKATTIPMVSVRLKHKALLIPKKLKHFYPTWRGKPTWVFSDRHARAEFFERQQKNFMRLKLPLPTMIKDVPFSEAEQKTFLSTLAEEDSFVCHAVADEKAIKTPWWQLRTRQVRKGWLGILNDRHVQITQQRLTFIKKIAEQPIPEDPEEKQCLWERLLRCYFAMDTTLLSTEANEQLNVLWESLTVKLEQTADFKAYGFIRAIALKKLISTDEYQLLVELLENLTLGNTTFNLKQFAEPFTTRCHLALLQKIKKLLKDEIAYDETLFKMTASLITVFNDESTKLILQKHISDYVIRQLLNILVMPSHQLTQAQCAVMTLEKFVRDYGDANLKNSIEKLATIRCDQSWQRYGEAVQELVAQLSAPHQHRYFAQEVARVNSALDFILATQAKVHSQTNAYEAITHTLHHIVERLVNKGTAQLKNIQLSAHEKTLVGLHHPERKIFQEAVELKAALSLSRQFVEKNPASLPAKLHDVKNLAARYAGVIPHLNRYISHKKPSYAGFFAKANRFTQKPTSLSTNCEVNHHVAFHRI